MIICLRATNDFRVYFVHDICCLTLNTCFASFEIEKLLGFSILGITSSALIFLCLFNTFSGVDWRCLWPDVLHKVTFQSLIWSEMKQNIGTVWNFRHKQNIWWSNKKRVVSIIFCIGRFVFFPFFFMYNLPSLPDVVFLISIWVF